MRSSQGLVRVISQVTRVKSSHLCEISSQVKFQVKNCDSSQLQSESVTWLVTTLVIYPQPWYRYFFQQATHLSACGLYPDSWSPRRERCVPRCGCAGTGPGWARWRRSWSPPSAPHSPGPWGRPGGGGRCPEGTWRCSSLRHTDLGWIQAHNTLRQQVIGLQQSLQNCCFYY